MPYLIGTDEAGYGPKLGPLVVAASVWRTGGKDADDNLYRRLGGCVANCIENGDDRIAIADSKSLYKPGGGLTRLERGLLAALTAAGTPTRRLSELLETLGADGEDRRGRLPWYHGFDPALPIDADAAEIDRAAAILCDGMTIAGVTLLAVRARVVFPEQLNELIESTGTKGAALSQVTLALAADAMRELEDGPIFMVCDKHGGRNRYQSLLQTAFPEWLIEVRGERRVESVYRWGPPQRRVEARFRVGGESFLPAALASMTAKYVRELAMRGFNAFWQPKVPGLRPTAGYPVDAARFKREILVVQQNLGIDDRILWRNR